MLTQIFVMTALATPGATLCPSEELISDATICYEAGGYDTPANVVSATYTSCMGTVEGGFDRFPLRGENPLWDLARIQNFSVCPSGLELRFKAMSEIIERMDINGVIFSSNRSCKVYSVMQMDLMRKIEKRFNIPTVMIDVDHADPRQYNEEKEFLKLEAMLERM